MIVYCREREGGIVRVGRALCKTPDHLQDIVAKMVNVPNMLDGQGWEYLADPNFVGIEVDNVGLVGMDKLVVGHSGRVHVTFWDGRLRGRELLCKRIAEHWMERFGLGFVYTTIPEQARTVIAFCKRVGFIEDSRELGYVSLVMKNCFYLHGAISAPRGGV